MMNNKNEIAIPGEIIKSKIYLIRGVKVMLDRDLAELYGVETKQLKRAVRRNIARFPDEFMFEMTKEELIYWRSQFGTSNSEMMGLRIPPFAFTEYGIVMLASVLNSEKAVQINIQIVKVFAQMRKLLETNSEILKEIERLIIRADHHEENFVLIFKYLKELEKEKEEEKEFKNRPRIGFR